MNKLITILIISFSANLFAQDLQWLKEAKEPTPETKLADRIRNKVKWQDIYYFGIEELNISEESLGDIALTLQLKPLNKNSTLVDSFFYLICDSTFTEFPYRKSGYLTNDIYKRYSVNNNFDNHLLELLYPIGGNLYPNISELLALEKTILVPQLIKYLSNDAATRLCLIDVPMRPWEKRHTYYLSISDIALDLIEMKTYCDFFDNASQSQMLFSNLSDKEKDEIITRIEKWMRFSNDVSEISGIEYFLDSICDLGHSYIYTCNNLLYSGDTLVAKTKYRHYYEENRLPCRKPHNVGKKLSLLGDDILMEDCLHDIYDYRCMADNGMKCVPFIFENAKSHIPFDVLADIVSTERFSRYKRSRSEFIWHAIFNEIATTENPWTKSIIVELLSIDDELKASKINAWNWERLYKEQFEASFRVCDFALVKYFEIIKKEVKLTYGNLDEKKMMNNILDEIDSLDMDSVEDRNKMIEIIKKYED